MKTRAIRMSACTYPSSSDLPKHGHAEGALARRWNGVQRTYSHAAPRRFVCSATRSTRNTRQSSSRPDGGSSSTARISSRSSMRQVDHSSAFRRSGEELRGGRVESRVDQPLRHLGQENAWDGDAGEVDHQTNVVRGRTACLDRGRAVVTTSWPSRPHLSANGLRYCTWAAFSTSTHTRMLGVESGVATQPASTPEPAVSRGNPSRGDRTRTCNPRFWRAIQRRPMGRWIRVLHASVMLQLRSRENG